MFWILLYILLGVRCSYRNRLFCCDDAYVLRKLLQTLTQEQFIEGYRKAQLIDVREAKDLMRAIFWEHVIFRTLSSVSAIKKSARTSPFTYMIKTVEKVHVEPYF